MNICHYGPLKNKYYLNDLTRKTYSLYIPKLKLGPKVKNIVKKCARKKTRVVNSKAIKFQGFDMLIQKDKKIVAEEINAIGDRGLELHGRNWRQRSNKMNLNIHVLSLCLSLRIEIKLMAS